MILTDQQIKEFNTGYTRTRGDDPTVVTYLDEEYQLYPHTRGWSLQVYLIR